MVVASLETSIFVVAGISAYFLLKERHLDFFRRSLGIALAMAALFAPLQIFWGDRSGIDVYRHQPAKLAAIEAHWETNTMGGAPYSLVALPNTIEERNSFEIKIPHGLSLLVTHSWNGQVKGLKEFPPQDRPNVPALFWSFRVMVAIGFLFVLVMGRPLVEKRGTPHGPSFPVDLGNHSSFGIFGHRARVADDGDGPSAVARLQRDANI
jgi:cytochrome d ubiquinol oxidase subunit I